METDREGTVDVRRFVGVVNGTTGRGKAKSSTCTIMVWARCGIEFASPARTDRPLPPVCSPSTRGTIVRNSLFDGYIEGQGELLPPDGALVSDRAGVTTPYALHNVQERVNFLSAPP